MGRRGILLAILAVAIALSGCGSRGPAPPSPTEDLTATIIGIVAQDAIWPPVLLEGGRQFAPPPGVEAVPLDNWGDTTTPESPEAGMLLLGGQRDDGTWWYQLAGYGRSVADSPASDGCWDIRGGSFDEASSIRLSDGLRLPKAAGFEVRGYGDPPWPNAFPGRGSDTICVDAQGRAVYLAVTGSA